MPKRRGPDKRPGTRQRRCKKRAPDDPTPPNSKRRRTISNTTPGAQEIQYHRIKEKMDGVKHTPSSSRLPDFRIQTTSHTSSILHRGLDHFVKV